MVQNCFENKIETRGLTVFWVKQWGDKNREVSHWRKSQCKGSSSSSSKRNAQKVYHAFTVFVDVHVMRRQSLRSKIPYTTELTSICNHLMKINIDNKTFIVPHCSCKGLRYWWKKNNHSVFDEVLIGDKFHTVGFLIKFCPDGCWIALSLHFKFFRAIKLTKAIHVTASWMKLYRRIFVIKS